MISGCDSPGVPAGPKLDRCAGPCSPPAALPARRQRGPPAAASLAFSSQHGNVAVVTGGLSGIGFSTAKHLAKLDMHVIIAGNKEREGQEAVKKIKEETLNSKAGIMMVPQRKTVDGFEEQFGVNYLGHFLLTNLLLDILKKTGSPSHNARVVTVSSATHYVGELNMEDLQSRHCYSPCGAYAQSKLALVLFSYRLQQLLASEGSPVTANVVDPGVVDTMLYKNVFWLTRLVKNLTYSLLFKTPDEGAITSIYAAVAPELEGVGGCYLYHEKITKSSDITYDEDLQRKLWAESCKLVRIPNVISKVIST
ncbi:polyprenol dehydrogenase isoform X5 [Petaurus breviceps papuanus]|uniref:polyprenol dehydrogenase isoform X5 n=1 Tax=Petaurus breviceps papuanus TaxID=3040969 RepID=UPI0036DA7899